MHQALSKVIKFSLSLLLLVTLFSCKTKEYITTYDYLNELSFRTGISLEGERDKVLNDLKEYGIYKDSDSDILDKNLTYKYMLDSILVFNEGEIVDLDYKDDDPVEKSDALKTIDKLVSIINNKEFDTVEEHTFKEEVKEDTTSLDINDIYFDEKSNSYKKVIGYDNGQYITQDASFEEIFEEMKLSSSEEINFDDAIIIDDEGSVEESEYVSENYDLLASKRHVINQKGYRISYKITSGVIDFRITKEKGTNAYVDFTFNKPII